MGTFNVVGKHSLLAKAVGTRGLQDYTPIYHPRGDLCHGTGWNYYMFIRLGLFFIFFGVRQTRT